MSKIFKQNKEKFLKYSLLLIFFISVLVGVICRFWNLSVITDRIFDEVYFPIFANDYLHGKQTFDVHPPLGKFLIAVGIYIFGDNSFGWRIVPALFGVGTMILFYFLAKRYFHKESTGWAHGLIALILIAIEPIFILYSRVGLMDGILFFFIFLSFFMALKVKKRRDVVWLCIVIGVAFSVKWVSLAIIVPVAVIMWQKKRFSQFASLLSFGVLVYSIIVALGLLIGGESATVDKIVGWNLNAWKYHHFLKEGHPWGSEWWSWPLMLRPVLMWFDGPNANGFFRVMTGMGNPILWWTASLAVLLNSIYLTLIYIKNWRGLFEHPTTCLLVGYFSFLLPWALVDRVVFIYHYLPSYGFALLILSYWLGVLWHKNRGIALMVLTFIFVVSIFYLPIVMALGIDQQLFDLLFFIKSWL